MASGDYKTVDFSSLPDFPGLSADFRNNLKIDTKVVEVNFGGKTFKVHTEQVSSKASESTLDVLFLHGMRFSSKNWVDINSVYLVATWGYRAVAVDLPGYGKTMGILEPEHNGEFLKELISALGMSRPVIVSPSMSGGFSLPYLFGQGGKGTDRARGYVPVAPVHTEKFLSAYKESEIPLLVVFGTNDNTIAKISPEHLMTHPRATYAPIEGAGHPCYLDNPDAFHKLFYDFLKTL